MKDPIIEWLLAADPSIRWQVQRDLLDLPESEWQKERSKVEFEGWGSKLLSYQDEDGQWAGGAFVPKGFTAADWKAEGQPYTATFSVLSELREMGLDPASPTVQERIQKLAVNCRWDQENGGRVYFEGETEECINGRVVADGAYFGVDVSLLVERLVGEQQTEGGWNCERHHGSTRASFDSTINVLEGLLQFEKATGGTPESRAARAAAQEFLLARHLFKRLSTGEAASANFLQFSAPSRWRYSVLRALDYFRDASLFDAVRPDCRLREAVDLVAGKRQLDGKWPLDFELPGRTWLTTHEGAGMPSAAVTLRALRVLKWFGLPVAVVAENKLH
ncbi:hypothetical protein BDR26DRAFT_853230 [Obelidium mucronatum]|nr:hypothetical protein BDR26DRAFT_853230 [Obelidium mucronatum]